MKRALAIMTAFALPALALADDKTPPANPPTKTTDKPAKLNEADVAVVAHVHHVNQMEIDLGKTAQKTGTTSVKSYSETLVSDHQSADKDLTALAKSHGLKAIPADKPQTEADKQEQKSMKDEVAHLKTLKGAEFDRAFLTMMVSGHDKEIAKVTTAIDTCTDPDLRTLLTALKPVLQRHADDARNLQKSPQASLDRPSDQPADPPIKQLPSAP
jgi:putative membrane protein